ncbi:hypothetical protein [Enterobacter phage 01_vB_Eclo_IJM]|nr:hypothetical protein [Enterobacter phage 01_vB_Eclo_IJM]
MVTYGLMPASHGERPVISGDLKHDAIMRHLKAVYEGRKRIHDSLHAEDK